MNVALPQHAGSTAQDARQIFLNSILYGSYSRGFGPDTPLALRPVARPPSAIDVSRAVQLALHGM